MLLVGGVGIYLLLPSLLSVFGSWRSLSQLKWPYALIAVACECASFVSLWALDRIALRTGAWFPVVAAQLSGNAAGRVLPGGGATAAGVAASMLRSAGIQTGEAVAALGASTALQLATAFALPMLALPAILAGVPVNHSLTTAAYLGAALFVLLVGAGAVAFTSDRPLELVGRAIQWLLNKTVRRHREVAGLPEGLLAGRDFIRTTIGEHRRGAILAAAGNTGFDYLALLAALHAVGADPQPSLVLLAYVAAEVLALIPFTPGGLGFVEAGLVGTLTLAGVPSHDALTATLLYRMSPSGCRCRPAGSRICSSGTGTRWLGRRALDATAPVKSRRQRHCQVLPPPTAPWPQQGAGSEDRPDGSGVAAAFRTLFAPARAKGADMSSSNASERPKEQRPENKPGINWRQTIGLFVALLILNYVLAAVYYGASSKPRITVPYNPTFLTQVRNGNVASITARDTVIQGAFKHAVRYPASDRHASAGTEFATQVPEFADTAALDRLLQQQGVRVTAKQPAGTPWWQTLLVGFGPTILFIGLWIWLIRRSGSQAGGMFSFGRAKAKKYEPTKEHTTFADVAGINEAKEELNEVVDFLRDPEKYRKLGAHIPRGVLLSGAPGTGKTLLARAVAGEAGVPFFSMSASEFVEMIVGVGASRVRDLFQQAKAAAPSIVFIDEIDAIGRSRGSGVFSGANDEREQTLNQILTEMDGFDASTGVIVLAATNRPDVLDSALLRPGRFDRRIAVQAPDKEGRKQILLVHTREVPLAPDVDLDAVAASTVGMVGADLANLANEAALLAARRKHERVQMADFSDSLEKIELGAARKLTLTVADKRRTAYHEAGHALVGMLTPGADPVRKISIIPRTMSLGVTLSAPGSDRFNYDKQALTAHIKVATGGRAAEEVVYGDETTGAESDIRQATQLARNMVGRFGMSDDVGFLSVVPQDGNGSGYPGYSEVSERTRQRVDDEMRRIVGEAHDEAVRLLSDNRHRLDGLAEKLFQAETLEGPEAYTAAGLEPPSDEGTAAKEPGAVVAEPIQA